jgi:hypothetical protein
MVAAKAVGPVKFETELIVDGVTRDLNIELERIPYEDSFGIVAYIFDMTDIIEREKELKLTKKLNEE